jgi:membrane protease YdiL (CAAX protease family)
VFTDSNRSLTLNLALTHPAGRTRTAAADDTRPAVVIPQYTRRHIIGIWAAAAIPMAFLSWVVAPFVADRIGGEAPLTRTLLVALTAGLVWQFVLVLALVAREQRTLAWPVLKQALWLRRPQSPRTGRIGGRMWWVLVPMALALAARELLPHIPPAQGRDMTAFITSPVGERFLEGAWGWFAVIVALGVFNTVLGEELLFRGFLLPRMEGAFGKRDWIANGGLFALYHLHVPWVIPMVLLDALILAYPARRYRSAVLPIIVHSVQTVFVTAAVLALVIG